jgi:hemerythrin-like domain-containing protein
MTAIKFLKQQHQDVRELFALFERAQEATDKDTICQQIADQLGAHMTIEEQIFYPAVFGALNDQTRLQKAMAEHQEAKDILFEILDMDMSLGESFDEKMRLLQQKIEQHVQEEESEIFEQARDALSGDEMDRLLLEMKALFVLEVLREPTERLTAEAFGDDEEVGTEEPPETSRL